MGNSRPWNGGTVPYRLGPYLVGIFPFIALTQALYNLCMVGHSINVVVAKVQTFKASNFEASFQGPAGVQMVQLLHEDCIQSVLPRTFWHSPPTFQWSYAVLFITNHEGVSTRGASLTGICLQMQVVWSARHHQESWMDCTCDSNITPKALFASHSESLTEGAWPKRLLIVVKNSQKHNPKNKSRVSESQPDRFQGKTFNAPQSHCLELHSFDFNVVFMWQKQSQQDAPLVSLWSRTGRLGPLFPYYLAHLESQLCRGSKGLCKLQTWKIMGCGLMWVGLKIGHPKQLPSLTLHKGDVGVSPIPAVKLLCSEKDPR